MLRLFFALDLLYEVLGLLHDLGDLLVSRQTLLDSFILLVCVCSFRSELTDLCERSSCLLIVPSFVMSFVPSALPI